MWVRKSMTNNKFKSEIIFFAIMISVYFALVNLANILSVAINIPNSINAIVEIIFPIAVIVYLKKKKLLSYYGINKLKWLHYKNLLFCIPMIIVALTNLRYGIHINYSWYQIILISIESLGVGFSEEILFRSFLMKAIMNKSSIVAISISSIVFGMLHIFNLFSGADVKLTIAQVIYATALGLVFAMFFYKTNNVIPCVMCHSVINITNTFLPKGLSNAQMCTGWIIIIITSIFYAYYLHKTGKVLIKKYCAKF